jgi:hypothetical protein
MARLTIHSWEKVAPERVAAAMLSNQRGMVYDLYIAIAAFLIALVLVGAEVVVLIPRPHHVPGVSLLLGAVFGALGTLGIRMVETQPPGRFEIVWGVVWTLLAICLAVGIALGMVYAPEWWRMLLFGVAAVLPLIFPLLFWRDVWRAR